MKSRGGYHRKWIQVYNYVLTSILVLALRHGLDVTTSMGHLKRLLRLHLDPSYQHFIGEARKVIAVLSAVLYEYFFFQILGELHLSVCHQPLSSKLSVTVLEARNLPKISSLNIGGIGICN